ncbi:hypothetical protein [Massilia scottii]|uniref:hypothetical protein n=1 Tax=Massilia scottii TaxID=3057166 RepID=UPI002796A2FA|nr:hypothetical protein [Massilia sp. CCM 9029]MDQ1829723.1 hypothetical protein [Massilia sp. CCM 9029]
MAFVAQAVMTQQAGSGILLAKGPRGFPVPRPPGGFPVDEFPTAPAAPSPSPGPTLLDPGVALLLLSTLANVLTNRYKDNKDEEEKDKCKVYPYSDAKKECPDGRSHHIVPDRSWRSPGTRGPNSGKISISALVDAMLDEVLPWRGGGYYYAGKMDEKKGQCICVTTAEHTEVHLLHDAAEKMVGEAATPKYTATLDELEEIGADSVSAVTKCDAKKIKDTLRDRHQALGLDKDTLLRADPRGQSGLTMEKFGEVLRNKALGIQ